MQSTSVKQQPTASILLTWINRQLHSKKLSANSISDLKGGNLFLQILHVHYPRIISLTKIYIKPKANYEIMQNFKYLAYIFRQLKWKKLQVDKFVSASISNASQNRDKQLITLTKYIYKTIAQNSLRKSEIRIKNKQLTHTQHQEQQKSTMSISLNTINVAEYKNDSYYDNEQLGMKNQIEQLEKRKKMLLTRIMDIQHIVKNTYDQQLAKNLILKVLDCV